MLASFLSLKISLIMPLLLQDSDTTVSDKPASVRYSIKFVTYQKKTEYSVRKWRLAGQDEFDSITSLKKQLKHDFDDILHDVAEDAIQMGYIEPGHGIKGRQHWIADDEDLRDMYQAHRKNKIMFWVYTGMKKRPQTPDASHPSKVSKTGYNSHAQKMLEIEEIVDDLEKRHKETYTREQYNVWAHMINLRRHSSRESAPNKPFFRGTKGAKPKSKDADIPTHATSSSAAEPTSVSTPALPTGISPGKRIQLRSQSMQQLETWHSLYEKGAIELEEYKNVQEKILSDIKQF